MKSVHSTEILLKGTFILTLAAVITKVLSALYRIPFQNIVGDIGFYIYQQVYPFYAIAVVLATTGFPVVISKLLTEQLEKGNDEELRFQLFICYLVLQFIGIICFIVLFLGANQIAEWMNDSKLAILIKVAAGVFLTFPIVSVLRGYFQATGNMIPTACSQVGEQTVRIATILFIAFLFVDRGYSLYHVGAGTMIGAITGSIIAAIILFIFLWTYREWKLLIPQKERQLQFRTRALPVIKALLSQGLMICLSGMLLIFIQLADSLNLYSLLTASGVEQTMAKSLKGIFDRGQPLIQLGTVAATSMSLTIVPLITRERIAAKATYLYEKIVLAVKVSIVIGMGASFGLWAIIQPTNIMLFENDVGSDLLSVLSFVILFTSIILTIGAIMQGIGSMLFPATAIVLVFPVKLALNIIFVPLLGTMGAAVSSILALAILCIVFYSKLKKIVAASLVPFRFWMVTAGSTLIMVIFLKGFLLLTGGILGIHHASRTAAAIQALSAVACGGYVFMLLIIKGKIFLEEELALFPFGGKLIHLVSGRDQRYGKKN
ncbi:putative polysaccharide biosynthesis protein [Bacillus rubiinfantis]|uniref:putative polysaccharide biosynthesis protein n=1 Tax=Bacillus rubiinfantis TaxID=1499680 RepID=UPI0005A873A0|nr:polysaccharide biosynthesis protein [Bacillus rubiinfantis]